MKRAFLIISLGIVIQLYGQSNNISMSLEDAIQYGLKNRYDMQSNDVQLDISKNEWNKNKYQWLPSLNGIGNIRYNTQLPTTVLPAGAFGNPDPSNVQFGTRNNTTLAIDFEQTIIKPTIFSDTKLGRNQYNQQQVRSEQKSKDIRKLISLAYYDALLKKRQWELSEDHAKKTKELADIFKSKFELGAIKENDYLKQKLDYQNAELKRMKSMQDYNLSIAQLKKEINFSESGDIELSEKMETQLPTNASVDTSFAFNTDLKILKLQSDFFKISRKRGILNSLPSINFYANYTLQFQGSNFDYGQNWFPFNFIGIRINVPIFNQWKNQATMKEFKLKMKQNDFDLQFKKQNLLYDYQKALIELDNASANTVFAEDNYKLAKTIYEKDLQQYTLGNISYSDLLMSSRSQTDAEQNLMQSWYSYHAARIQYQNVVN
jgi:outer membrane protein